MKTVKIYGTLGPACADTEILKRMFDEGMDGIRLNLSHMTLEEASVIVETYHKAARECGITPELLIDMQGPELRIGRLEKPLLLEEGALVSAEDIVFPEGVKRVISEKGSLNEESVILLDDGKILLKAENATPDAGGSDIRFRVLRGGLLESSKSVAVPGVEFDTPAMTDMDKINIGKAREYGVTGVMQPFVRTKEDLKEVRTALDQSGCGDLRLLGKIENIEGMKRLDEIILFCDEIVIARGDLGNAMDLWELPAAQKRIAASCREAERDFMVVTQMLDSMIKRQVPTRAEVTDIFNAVLDGAVSVMLTGETASGDNPVGSIRYMVKTVREAEAFCSRL